MALVEDKRPIETHEVHSDRLMRHAVEQLAKGDRLQASEKAWGAAAHRLKDFAERRGWKYEVHADAHKVIGRLVRETGDRQIRRLFRIASALHKNYYVDTEEIDTLAADLEDVRLFIGKLDELDANGFGMSPPRRSPVEPSPFRQRRRM